MFDFLFTWEFYENLAVVKFIIACILAVIVVIAFIGIAIMWARYFIDKISYNRKMAKKDKERLARNRAIKEKRLEAEKLEKELF